MKVNRQEVYNKFQGHCCYCGNPLKDKTGKFMHVEHFLPVKRNGPKSQWLKRWGDYRVCENPENGTEENLYPCCPKCNIIKNSMPLESFRDLIKDTIRQLERSATFQRAKRYNMIKLEEWDGIFYFEKQ
jgi:5-methylcytosine-specific restriction endonuclease McrA